MKNRIDLISVVLILLTVYSTRRGWAEFGFFERYAFLVDGILLRKQWERLVTAGFLHLDVPHLSMNMITLYLFGSILNDVAGVAWYLAIYIASIIGGNALALYFHRHHGDYSAAGASGGVSGVVFAMIALDPQGGIAPLFLPLHMPGWIYGVLYLLYTLYGVKRKHDNIGHEAHLGGAIVGMMGMSLYQPSIWQSHPIIVGSMLGMFLGFMILSITHPNLFIFPERWMWRRTPTSNTQAYSSQPAVRIRREKPASSPLPEKFFQNPEEELNALLDKVREKGLDGLSEKDRQRLRELSERMR